MKPSIRLSVPVPTRTRAAELVARVRRRHQDRAADRVATEQRALRSAQHLHVGDIAQRHRAADRVADVDVVDVQADAWIYGRSGIGLPDAADENLRRGVVARQRRVVRELQVRHHLVEHVGTEDLPIFQRAAAQCSDGDRRVLQVLLHLARRDDDLFEALRLLLLRMGRGCQPRAPQRGGRVAPRPRLVLTVHVIPLLSPVRTFWICVGQCVLYPQTSCAVSTTSRSLPICSSRLSALPSSVEEKPHCGLRQSCSSGT